MNDEVYMLVLLKELMLIMRVINSWTKKRTNNMSKNYWCAEDGNELDWVI